MQRFIAYLSLEEWLKFVSVFPSWKFTFPDVIVLSEDCSTTLMCLLERKLNCQIRTLELKGPGPTSAGGALGILHKCLALEGQAFSCLVHLDLSAQMQPIDYFLQLFHGRISAFPLLRFLSARLTDPDRSDQLIDEVTAPPLLDEVKLFLVSYISEEDPFLPQLLRLLRNIAVLTVCEGMVDCVPWLHFIGSPELRDTLCRLQYLSVDAGSELLEVVHNMPFVERNVRFPALREVYVPTTCTSYDRALLENGVSFADEALLNNVASSSESNFLDWTKGNVQIGRWTPLGPRAHALMLELLFFPDNPTPTSEVSSALLFVRQFGHLVEKLVITVCPSLVPESLTEYISFLNRFKALCKTHLLRILTLTSPKLRSVEIPAELADPRSIDPEFEAALVRHRAQFYSVKACFIKSPVGFTFCNSAIWHSCHCLRNIPHSQPMKNICGLFPGLEDLIITSDSHLDPEDLGEVPNFCPLLRRLFLHKWPYSLYQYSQIIQEILSTSKLEVLCLIVDHFWSRNEFDQRMVYLNSPSLKYLYVDCIFAPCISRREVSRLSQCLPKAKWIMVANEEAAKCVEFRRNRTVETVTEMRLGVGQQRREPSSFCPELYGVIWREERRMKHLVDHWCHV
ncbi:hypothetical protein AAHC03_09626 [Spirometra sp. Aus1]